MEEVNMDPLPDEYFSNFMDKDNIMDEWILTNSPTIIIVTLASYLLIVLKIGPTFMKDKAPFKLNTVMRLYDVSQVAYNLFILHEYLSAAPVSGRCPIVFVAGASCRFPADFEGIDHLKRLYLNVGWHYIVLKITDLLDTIFMVLRKKNSHITVLHLYHHSAMVFFAWFTMKYIKASQAAVPVFINTFVHVVMYSYYFLATFERCKPYLWWKSHLTKLQLTQFVIVLGYLVVIYTNSCEISRLFTFIWTFNVFVIMCLFINFYLKTYIQKSDTKEAIKLLKVS